MASDLRNQGGAAAHRNRRALLVGAVLALAVLAAGAAIIPKLRAAAADSFGKGDYILTATDGTPFTEDTLQGQFSAVFFGFTHCPEVCPTTLGDIGLWQEELGPDADKLKVYFVTVDPERDTAALLGDYVGWLPNAIGVTGPRPEIDKALAAFHIFARRVPLSDGGYTMDHSAYVLLFGPDGLMFEPIGYGEATERAVDKIRRLMASG